MSTKVDCPCCGKTIGLRNHHYNTHHVTSGTHYCPLSGQPATSCGEQPEDYRTRAATVCYLAAQLRDRDPALTYSWLCATERDELIRLMIVALAAVPVDKPASQIFGWVTALPAARQEATL